MRDGGPFAEGGSDARPEVPEEVHRGVRRQIVALYDGGEPAAEIMREYDLGKSTFQRWVK